MSRFGVAVVLIAAAGATIGNSALAQKPSTPAASGSSLNACTILTRDEVKKIFPWGAQDDQAKERTLTSATSSICVYPSVQFGVAKYSTAKMDAARKIGPLSPVTGVGDEAYLQQNGRYWALLYVKVGDRWVSIEKDVPAGGTLESLQRSLVALGKALAAKLR